VWLKKGKESEAQEIIISRRQIVEYNQNRIEILVIQLSKMRQSSYVSEHQQIMLIQEKDYVQVRFLAITQFIIFCPMILQPNMTGHTRAYNTTSSRVHVAIDAVEKQ
jgi:hypothetical protein